MRWQPYPNPDAVLTLDLPFACSPCHLAATGRTPEWLLARLATILCLEPTVRETATETPVVILSDCPPGDDWTPWEGSVRFQGQVFWQPDACRLYFQLENFTMDSDDIWRVLIRTFQFSVINRILHYPTVMLHGALLDQDGQGVVLFGPCGMGKSTSCRRFASQGGKVLGDDKLFVTFQDDGSCLAQPCPTWSRDILSDDIATEFATTLPLKALLFLNRGDDDSIAPIQPAAYHLHLLQSNNNFFRRPADAFPPAIVNQVTQACLPRLESLCQKFGYYELQGDLQGHIRRHLQEFLAR